MKNKYLMSFRSQKSVEYDDQQIHRESPNTYQALEPNGLNRNKLMIYTNPISFQHPFTKTI